MSTEEDINTDSPEPSGNSKDSALFKPKPKPKIIRVLTVLAYVLSVSMAAILLSIYYIFMWDGQPHLGARKSLQDDFNEPIVANSTDASKSVVLNGNEHPVLNVSFYLSNQPIVTDGPEKIQQISSIEDDEFNYSSLSTTPSTTEETTSWEHYESELIKRNTFIKKLIYNNYRYTEND